MIRAGPDCLVLAGRTQASTVISPVRRTASVIFVAGLSEWMSVLPRTSRAPSERRTFLGFSIFRSSGWPAPERSLTILPLAKRKSYSTTNPSALRSAAHAPSGLARAARNKDTISWLKKALTRLVSNNVPTYYDSVFHCVLTFFHFTEPPIGSAIS